VQRCGVLNLSQHNTMVDDEDDVTAENSGPSGFAGNSSTARNMSTVQVPRHEERFEGLIIASPDITL